MRLPKVVESGVEDHIILDCLYEYGQSEAAQIDVKWFFGDDPQPFYQWLPGRRPQTIGELFRNRIDLDYEVETDDEYARHRAVKLLRPTAELSGTYKCKVSSFVDEDFMSKKMLVYGKCTKSLFPLLLDFVLRSGRVSRTLGVSEPLPRFFLRGWRGKKKSRGQKDTVGTFVRR